MVRTEIFALFVSAAFLVLQPKTGANPNPSQRPLCAAQFELANHACAALPYIRLPPPPPPAPPIPPAHQHRHGHGHRPMPGGHQYHESPVEENCCRWLKQVDDECVCDLILHLPPFLARPAHAYFVSVDESCNVTYSCGGRLIP